MVHELMAIEPWTLLDSQEQLSTRIFALHRTRARSPASGVEHAFSVLQAPDWVNVIAITPDSHVVLIRQFRHGTAEVTTEIPGGTVDPGETPLQAAVRELAEETGFASEHWEPCGVVEPNPAFLNNRTHTFVAHAATKVGPQRQDDSEDIEVFTWPLARVSELLRNGTIQHALVVCAFTHFALHKGIWTLPG